MDLRTATGCIAGITKLSNKICIPESILSCTKVTSENYSRACVSDRGLNTASINKGEFAERHISLER